MIKYRDIDNFIKEINKVVMFNKVITFDDLIEFIVELGGNLKSEELDDYVTGKIIKEGESFTIIFNQNTNYKTFDIAHLIGHLLIHMNFLNTLKWKEAKDFIDDWNVHSQLQNEATMFAEILVMDEIEFKKKAQEFAENNKVNVIKLADYFKVPLNSIYHRGYQLCIFEYY